MANSFSSTKADVDNPIPFARLLRRLRKQRDLTQETLAQQAFCSLDTIKKIETGVRRPSLSLATQFADCLVLVGDERVAFLRAARAPTGQAIASEAEMVPERQAALPYYPTRLVGREAELAGLDIVFADQSIRLVTLTGPGGIGKTRLASTLAEQFRAAQRFPSVCFVPLVSLDTAEQVVAAIATALNIPLDAGRQPARSLRQQVFDYLRSRQLLLILDNVEHLLGSSADGDVASLISELLSQAPDLRILATSRERLKLRLEQVFPLGGLHMATGETTGENGAETLFVQCARLVRPDFAPTPGDQQVIAHICRQIDGMPLAIELAAGWADTLALSDIAAAIERGIDLLATDLRDIPARHRSMRAVFDASYQRLGQAEQLIFARLAVFRGSVVLEAVQAVTQATLAQLQTLIGTSLLSYDAGRGRYTLHELVRQYALEKLQAVVEGEALARDQHAAFYCTFAQRQGEELTGANQQAALAALELEHDNLRTGWAWAARQGRTDLLARAADSLGFFYEWRTSFDEGEHTYQHAAAQLRTQPADNQTLCMLTALLAWQSVFRRLRGDIAGAAQLLQESLALLERIEASHHTQAARAFTLLQRGLIASEGVLEDAHDFFEESLALYQALGRRWEASNVLLWLGDLARYQGHFDVARRHFRASLDIRAACGDRRGIAEALIWDSHAAADSGQVDEAVVLARQSYAIYEELGDSASRAFGLGELGIILMYTGRYGQSYQALQESLALYNDLGNHAMGVYAQGWLAVACLGIGEYRAARRLTQQAAIQARDLSGATGGLAFMLHDAGWAALAAGEHQEAKALLQESAALHQQNGNLGLFAWPLAQLGYIHWLLGDRHQAEAALQQVLQIAVRQHAFLPLLLSLPVIALMLAEQGHRERAAELYSLAWRHPFLSNAHCFLDSFQQPLDAVVATLPPEIATAAQERGQLLDPWETGAALVQELLTMGWSNGQ